MSVSKTSIGSLFDDGDDAELVDAIAAAVSDLRDGPEASSLRKEHLYVWRIWESAGRVSNGGYECLFESPELDLEEGIEALEAIGARDAVRELRRAADVFPKGKPHQDVDERMAYLEKLPPHARKVIDEGGEPLYHDSILPLLADYVRSRKEVFIGLAHPGEPGIFARPSKTGTPGKNAPGAEVARWLIGLGGTVQFHEHRYPNGNRQMFFELPLPEGKSTLAGFEIPSERRDTDATLEILAAWDGARNIVEVSLQECRIGESGLRYLTAFEGLTGLDLAGARIDDDALKSLVLLKTLRRLNLSGTKITDTGIEFLASLSSLIALDIVGTKVPGKSLKTLCGLDELLIGGAGFKDRALSFLNGMNRLRVLHVHGARLGPGAIAAVASRKGLESLLLWNTGLKEKDLAGLTGMVELADLSLEGIPITERGVETILTLPGLKRIHVGGDEITPQAKELLRNRRPDLKME